MVEIQKRPHGTVAARAWAKAQNASVDLPEQLRPTATILLQQRCGSQVASQPVLIREFGQLMGDGFSTPTARQTFAPVYEILRSGLAPTLGSAM